MTKAILNTIRKINRSLRSWVDIKIQALIWPIVYREVKTMLDKFELSDEASEEIKNRLLLVDHDEMKSAIDNEIYKRDLITTDDANDLIQDALSDYVLSDIFEEFEQSTNETLGEIQDRLTDLEAESLTLDDIETKIDEKLNERLEHYLVDADYEDINERIGDLENRVNMIVEKIGSMLEKMDNIGSGRKESRLVAFNIGETLRLAGQSIKDESMEEE
jgi:predicted nucleic acid-binding OB-fold protein